MNGSRHSRPYEALSPRSPSPLPRQRPCKLVIEDEALDNDMAASLGACQLEILTHGPVPWYIRIPPVPEASLLVISSLTRAQGTSG